jgi:hypothetical protein
MRRSERRVRSANGVTSVLPACNKPVKLLSRKLRTRSRFPRPESLLRVRHEAPYPRRSRGARRTAEELIWEREIERLDRSYREVCDRAMGWVAA